MLYKDLAEDDVDTNEEFINNRYEAIRDTQLKVTVSLTKYILGGNVGGIATLMTYHKVMGLDKLSDEVKLSLLCFVLGGVLIGVLLIFIFFRFVRLSKVFDQAVEKYHESKICMEDIYSKDKSLVPVTMVGGLLLLLSAFVNFILGVIFFIIPIAF